MSKTLFWYLLKDLLRIFLLASGTLAGIMSFGALLRPLTQHGLDISQVGRILSYFQPAMTTYSLPIAALFATTIVYGRLSADNELTACRATGISHLAMTWPAILLGLLVALVSLLFLSFVVPVFTLKVEKVIYSNIAQLVANKITRTHEISYGRTSIFAQDARVIEPIDQVVFIPNNPAHKDRLRDQLTAAGLKVTDAAEGLSSTYGDVETRRKIESLPAVIPEGERGRLRIAYLSRGMDAELRKQAMKDARDFAAALREIPPVGVQMVEMISPMVFSYTSAPNPENPKEKIKVPSRVWIAKRALAFITPKGDEVYLEAVLEDGANFPRASGGSQVSVAQAQFGPVQMATPIRENTKFMDVQQLKEVLNDPRNSRKLRSMVQQFIKEEQRAAFFEQIRASLANNQLRSFRFTAETETLIVSGSNLVVTQAGPELVINPNPRTALVTDRVQVNRESNGEIVSQDKAKQIRITVDIADAAPTMPDDAPRPATTDAAAAGSRRMNVNIRGYDVIIEADEDPAAHETFPRSINVPMPASLLEIEKNDIPYYLHNKTADRMEQEGMRNAYNKLISGVRSEMHSRASFAVSCFILVMVGCALGMISKSGNFLSAFAVSVVPALMCIALIVTGQHVCENTPKSMGMGLTLIWSGNVIVFLLAAVLLGRLHRT